MNKPKSAWRWLKKDIAPLLLTILLCFLAGPSAWATGDGDSPGQAATVLFIDAGVQGAPQLLEDLANDITVVRLRSDVDGVQQITNTLKNYRELDSIQIVSHGAPGELALGASVLADTNLDRHRAALRTWGQALTPGGGVLLYGCNVAQGEAGDRFVERIARIAGAPVAASTDATGSPALGGNWTLEKQTSPIPTKSVLTSRALSGYANLLLLPSNGVKDITASMANGTSTLVSFVAGFNFVNDTGTTYTGDPGVPDGIYSGQNSITSQQTNTFTVNADGTNLVSFDLTALSFTNFGPCYWPFNFTVTGYKLGGGTVTATFAADRAGAFTSGDYTPFTSITGFQVSYTGPYAVDVCGSTGYGPPGNITFDSFTIANASATTTYTVTYNGNGNTGGSAPTDGSSPYASGSTVTVLGNTGGLTKTGYTFATWNTAAGGGGISYSAGNTFTINANTTLYAQWTANPPSATTGSASGIGFNGATLGGTVNDNGLAVTAISFDYGTTVAYGSTATATPSTLGAGAGATAVSASIGSLTCGTTYHFRVNATSAGGTTNGGDNTFTTSACTVPGTPTIGTATAGDAQASITFSAPASNGGSAITGYTATSSPGSITGTCAASPCTVTGLTNGTAYTFTVTATNGVGTGPASAASNSVTPKANQTITFANPGAQNFGTTPTLTATASSSQTVSFTSSTTGVCTITTGGALTFVTTGTCTINADQAGNAIYNAAPTVTQSFAVNAVVPGAPTIGTATAGDTQASVTFSAPASNGGAAITTYTATSSPGSFTGTCGSSPCTVTGLTNGTAYTFTVTATNSAGTGSASSASNSVTPNAAQTITFSNPGAQNFGTTPTLTATASSGLTVSFTSSTTGMCTITTGGALTFVTTGICTINADQAGNASYSAAPTVTQSFAVNPVVPGAPTIGTATAGNAQATVAFTAPASNGGATITGYTATSSPGGFTGTCAASPCTVTGLTNGTAYTFTVTATNSVGTGSASTASNSVTPMASLPGAPTIGTATAGDAQASITFTAPASDGGAAITIYTATSSPGGLTGTCAGPAACTITVTGLTNGTAYTFTVTATNGVGTGPASAASNSVTPKANQTITFGNPGAQNFGTTPTLTATASSGLTVSFTSSTTGVCTITTGGALTFVTPGTCTINADQAGNAIYNAAPTVTQSFAVNAVVPGAPTIGTATAGDTQATVTFTAPAANGGAAITTYTATSSPGGFTGTCAGPAACTITVTGLTNGTTYTFTVTATNSVGAGPASAASNSVIPGAAVCGTADGSATAFAPTANLCATGTPSAVASGSPWTWTCSGTPIANCSAPNASLATSGTGRATIAGGTWTIDTAASAGFIPTTGHPKSPPNLPAGYTFPYGLFDFVLVSGVPGSSATVTITYSSALPPGTVYWKYGPTPGQATPHWYQFPATIAGNTVTLTITDGGLGDDDLTADGTIIDQGGPGVGAGAAATAVPTLGEWTLIVLAGLLAIFGMAVLARQRDPRRIM